MICIYNGSFSAVSETICSDLIGKSFCFDIIQICTVQVFCCVIGPLLLRGQSNSYMVNYNFATKHLLDDFTSLKIPPQFRSSISGLLQEKT